MASILGFTIFIFFLGLLGLIYNKKITDLTLTSHANFYGGLFGKKVKKELTKEKEEHGYYYGFLRFVYVTVSLVFFLMSILLFWNMLK